MVLHTHNSTSAFTCTVTLIFTMIFVCLTYAVIYLLICNVCTMHTIPTIPNGAYANGIITYSSGYYNSIQLYIITFNKHIIMIY